MLLRGGLGAVMSPGLDARHVMTAGPDGVRWNQSLSHCRACRGADKPSGSLVLAVRPLCFTSSHHRTANLGMACNSRVCLALCCCYKGALKTWVVACPFRHDGPGGARHLVGQSHGHKLERLLGQQHPGPVGEP